MTYRPMYMNEGIPSISPETRVLPVGTIVYPIACQEHVHPTSGQILHYLVKYSSTWRYLSRPIYIDAYRLADYNILPPLPALQNGSEFYLHLFPSLISFLSASSYTQIDMAGFVYQSHDLMPRKIP